MTRELTSHIVNGLNEAITISVLDQPGAGGACHVYRVVAIDPSLYESHGTLDIEKTASKRFGCCIEFQNGPIQEGVNGISNESLLAILEDRLAGFQSGQFACDDTGQALGYVRGAMHALKKRTRERAARGVEGKLQV